MTANHRPRARREAVPGVTACGLCVGETLEGRDPLPGGQRSRLERLLADGVARLTFVECLDECERGDVVVARPTAARRAEGAAPVWFERLAGDALTAELSGWLAGGGPGSGAVPPALAAVMIDRTRDPEDRLDVSGPTSGAPQHHSAHHHEGNDAMSENTAIDPVCGMTVDPATAAATAEHDGTTYYFCAKGCQKAFLADPAQYV